MITIQVGDVAGHAAISSIAAAAFMHKHVQAI